MSEHPGAVTFKGGPLTLLGDMPNVGDAAPDVELVANDLSPVKLSSFRGKPFVLLSVPSLDTEVCDMEVRRFNKEAASLSNGAQVVTVSVDLPFAQARWCGAAGIDRVVTLSDHRDAAFGQAYGVLVKTLRLLARAVFVLDDKGVITHQQLVKEIADQPDYDAALNAVKSL